MSIEYTIDIQLTELGFPDILPSSNIETGLCKPLNSAQSLEDEQADKETAHDEPSEPSAHDVTAGADTTDPPQLITGQDNKGKKQGDTAQEEEEEDSDDSDVSEIYEEEEVDEDDEDEEGLNNELGDYRCSVCDLQLPSKFKLQDHMNLHTGARPYCCAECGKRFCQNYNYRVHLRTHAQIKLDRLRCRVCLKCFVSQDDLTNHLSRTHLEDEFYECDLCKRVFTNLKECEYHVQLHKGLMYIACDKCGRNFSCQKSLTRHQKKTCFSSFKCTDCTKIFTNKNALLKHSFSHLGLLPYTCMRCHRHFRLAKLYRQHKCEPQRIHCVACLREFLSQEDFQQHKKDTGCWGNQEPKGDEIRCLECGQRFVTTEELKKHAGAHQRVLKCAECGKGFRSALLLMSHMGGHAGNAPCLCQSCGLGFPHQQSYDSHLKTCGQTPQPASAPKKRPAPKSSPPEAKRLKANPDAATPTNIVTKPAAPVTDSSSPGPVTEAESAGSSPADGLWKLTLDKQPPPGVNLVLLVPICPTQSNGLTVPSAVSPTLPGSAAQFQPQHLLANAALGAPPDVPLDLVTGIKRDPEYDAPLDLSKKCNPSKKCNSSKSAVGDIPLLPVKSEPEDFEISGGSVRQEITSSDNNANVEPNREETDTLTEVKRFGMDPVDLSSKLIIDFKDEPQS